MQRAIIVGSEGQDGRILYDRLRQEDYALLGVGRGTIRSTEASAPDQLDVLDREAVRSLVAEMRPDEVYYLAAHHRSSEQRTGDGNLEEFEASFRIHVTGLLNFLEALREHRRTSPPRLVYAASCRIFGDSRPGSLDESSPFQPESVYGITKMAGLLCCRFYRNQHGLHASTCILFNHESPLRRPEFVSQRIIRGVLAIRRNPETRLVLGDLTATIDWGYAPDHVDAMVRIVRLPEPGEFVVATGEAHTVQEFARIAFELAGLDWRAHVEENPSLVARRGVRLVGDAGKLRLATGWKPSVPFEEMIRLMWHAARTGESDRER